MWKINIEYWGAKNENRENAQVGVNRAAETETQTENIYLTSYNQKNYKQRIKMLAYNAVASPSPSRWVLTVFSLHLTIIVIIIFIIIFFIICIIRNLFFLSAINSRQNCWVASELINSIHVLQIPGGFIWLPVSIIQSVSVFCQTKSWACQRYAQTCSF